MCNSSFYFCLCCELLYFFLLYLSAGLAEDGGVCFCLFIHRDFFFSPSFLLSMSVNSLIMICFQKDDSLLPTVQIRSPELRPQPGTRTPALDVGRGTRAWDQHEIVSHQTRLQTSVWMFLTWPEGQKSKHEPSLNSNTDDVWQLWRLWVWNQLPPKRTVKFQTWSLFVSIPRSLNMLLFDLWSSFPASSRLYVCPGLLQSAAGWKGSRSWFRRNVFHWLREPSIFTRWLVQRSEAGAPLGRQRWC